MLLPLLTFDIANWWNCCHNTNGNFCYPSETVQQNEHFLLVQ